MKDAYKSLIEALNHGGLANRVQVKLDWIEAEIFEGGDPSTHLEDVHGILVPGGFGQRGAEGKILAARFARQRKVPYFGICFGMQMAVIEAARSLGGVPDANSTEFGPCAEPVVGLLTEWMRGNALEKRLHGGNLGGTMRLGAYPADLMPGSRIAGIYGDTQISERHRHRYEVNTDYRQRLEAQGMVFSGLSPDGLLPETIELADHPWFIGVQYHPELKSRPFEPASAIRQLHRRCPRTVAPGLSGWAVPSTIWFWRRTASRSWRGPIGVWAFWSAAAIVIPGGRKTTSSSSKAVSSNFWGSGPVSRRWGPTTRPRPSPTPWPAISGDGRVLPCWRCDPKTRRPMPAHFAKAGVGLGKALRFGRTAEAADGVRREVAFTIAFALDPTAPSAEFFVCQHHNPENFWNPAVQSHPNTARRLAGIVLVAEQPYQRLEFLGRLFGQDAVKTAGWGVLVETEGGPLEIVTPDVLLVRYGAVAKAAIGSDLGFAAFRIEVDSLEAVQRFLNVMGSPYERRDERLIVPASVARGAALSFEPCSSDLIAGVRPWMRTSRSSWGRAPGRCASATICRWC